MAKMMDRRHSSSSARHMNAANGGAIDDAEAALISKRKHEIRTFRPGRCLLARKRLNAVFHMRRYFRVVLGLTGVEALLVVCRLMLETESLRYPPGNMYKSLIHAELSLFCISLPILLLFVIEQPFKWWAFGSARFCKSVLLVLDALVCIACLSLNIHNIHNLANRPTIELAPSRQLEVCGVTHITHAPNTAWTFALALGIVILFRCWCIHGFVTKSINLATAEKTTVINTMRRELDAASTRIAQLEAMIQDQAAGRHGPSKGSIRTPTTSSSHSRSTPRRSVGGYDSRQPRPTPDSGEPV